ncbi:hypothetical protein OBBRIDRAFT_804894 [Obba rivulosa]|uniref:Uncharacterized protein n=1 Tax=Obba rivulosa TaxID=1052685 RepID=A0A8E2B0Z1_9APHY|nr:hypothetical protein OBBRIDRAFT_804894 [Obba rivulosa]
MAVRRRSRVGYTHIILRGEEEHVVIFSGKTCPHALHGPEVQEERTHSGGPMERSYWIMSRYTGPILDAGQAFKPYPVSQKGAAYRRMSPAQWLREYQPSRLIFDITATQRGRMTGCSPPTHFTKRVGCDLYDCFGGAARHIFGLASGQSDLDWMLLSSLYCISRRNDTAYPCCDTRGAQVYFYGVSPQFISKGAFKGTRLLLPSSRAPAIPALSENVTLASDRKALPS